MVVKSATKKWLIDGGMPELYAHILADERKPYDDVFFGDKKTMNKALIKMNYEEIADCLLENVKFPVQLSSAFHLELGEKLQKVRQYWIQRLEKWQLVGWSPLDFNLRISYLKDWDIKNYGLRAGYWEFMNWNENPFQTK